MTVHNDSRRSCHDVDKCRTAVLEIAFQKTHNGQMISKIAHCHRQWSYSICHNHFLLVCLYSNHTLYKLQDSQELIVRTEDESHCTYNITKICLGMNLICKSQIPLR